MADKIVRECISVGVAENGVNSVLVVSTDEDRVEYRSNVFRYKDFMEGPSKIVFDEEEWIGSMWVSPTGKYYLSEVLGSCYTNATGRFVRARVTSSKLYNIWGLHDRAVYVIGSDGACHKYDGQSWSALNVGFSAELHAIGGLSETLLVCAGDNGFIARWDGSAWRQIDVPTNGRIRCVHVVDEALAYFGGYNGLCFRLKDDEFEEIVAPAHDLYSVASWRGEIYFGSISAGIFKVNGNALEPIRPDKAGADIKVSSDYLFTCGGNKYTRFDGTDWKSRPFT